MKIERAILSITKNQGITVLFAKNQKNEITKKRVALYLPISLLF